MKQCGDKSNQHSLTLPALRGSDSNSKRAVCAEENTREKHLLNAVISLIPVKDDGAFNLCCLKHCFMFHKFSIFSFSYR